MRTLTIVLMTMLTVIIGVGSATASFVNYDSIRNMVFFGGHEVLTAVPSSKIKTVSKTIYKVDFERQKEVRFFMSENYLSAVKLSSNCSYVSVVENVSLGFGKPFFNRLLVLNKKGEIEHEIGYETSDKAIKVYEWDSSDRFIAFITGKHRGEGDKSGSMYTFLSTGAYLYDVEKKNITKLADAIYKIKWAEFDNNLYLMQGNGIIFKYDMETQQISKTDDKAWNFSPDGKYSARTLWYDESDPFFEVFQRQNNERIVLFNSDRDKQLMVINLFWSNDSKHLLNGPYTGSFVYNVPEKRIVRKIDHYVLGWNRGLSKIVSYDRKRGVLIVEDLLTGNKLTQYKFEKGPWKRP